MAGPSDAVVFRVKRGHTQNNCGDVWIDGEFFMGVATIGLVSAAFLLNQAITMNGRRKKRRRKRGFDTSVFQLGT